MVPEPVVAEGDRVRFMVVMLGACTGLFGADPPPVEEEASAPRAAAPPPTAIEATEEPELAASHILIGFEGAVGASRQITRTEEEARAIAADLRLQLSGGADFAALAAQHSDDPSSRRGGQIGAFLDAAVDPAFAAAVAEVEVGSVTEPFRTGYGWHVARRDPLALPRARHILVSYKGARQSSEMHTSAHARRMLDMLELRLSRGADFAKLAAEFSNDTTANEGGDLGPVGEGQLLPVLESAIAKLRPGQRTVVESAYGWHLVERTQ